MFEILGSEIYQSDPNVFLRELLQNSIDAIRVRQELERRRIREGVVNGLIQIRVEHDEAGNQLVKCTDNGLGMDQYIIQKYLSVAGRSYYRSNDFEALSLGLDPISRFGIGILSCFMVADSVEITTFYDSKVKSTSKPLRIEIVRPDAQWRVYNAPTGTQTGTCVCVKVLKSKLEDISPVYNMSVTDYICHIAGFVEYPILIEEFDWRDAKCKRRTIVLHPDYEIEAATAEFGPNTNIHQLKKELSVEESAIKSDQEAYRQYFESDYIDVKNDLKIPNCEGFVLSARLKNESLILKRSEDKMAMMDGTCIFNKKGKKLVACIKSNALGTEYSQYRSSTSSQVVPSGYSVYNNGILVSRCSGPSLLGSGDKSTGLPRPPEIRLNLLGKQSVQLNISRTNFIHEKTSWDYEIWNALKDKVLKLERASSKGKNVLDRIINLYSSTNRFALSKEMFSEMARTIGLLDGWIESNGFAKIGERRLTANSEVALIPEWFLPRLAYDLEQSIIGAKNDTYWRGTRSYFWNDSFFGKEGILNYLMYPGVVSDNRLIKKRIQFITSPSTSYYSPPSWQFILEASKIDVERDAHKLLERGAQDAKRLSHSDLLLLYKEFAGSLHVSHLFQALPFSKPFDSMLAYGADLWNLDHPTTRTWIQACLGLMKLQMEDKNEQLFKTLRFYAVEALSEWFNDKKSHYLNIELNIKLWNRFWKEFKHSKIAPKLSPPSFPSQSDFIPDTWNAYDSKVSLFEGRYSYLNIKYDKPWGRVITHWPTK